MLRHARSQPRPSWCRHPTGQHRTQAGAASSSTHPVLPPASLTLTHHYSVVLRLQLFKRCAVCQRRRQLSEPVLRQIQQLERAALPQAERQLGQHVAAGHSRGRRDQCQAGIQSLADSNRAVQASQPCAHLARLSRSSLTCEVAQSRLSATHLCQARRRPAGGWASTRSATTHQQADALWQLSDAI